MENNKHERLADQTVEHEAVPKNLAPAALVEADQPHASNKRRSYVIIFAAVLTVGLVAFAMSQMFTHSSSSRHQRIVVNTLKAAPVVTINMMGQWKGEDLRQNYIEDTLKQFEIENPTIKVNLQYNRDFPDGRTGALNTIIDEVKTNKIGWDIVWMEPFNYQPVADAVKDQDWGKKNLVDFEKVPGFIDTQKPFILSDPQYRNHFAGMMTGPYMEGFYQPLFFNKEVADQMNIKVKDKGMTFDDYAGYVKQVAQYNAAHSTTIAAMYEAGGGVTGGAGGGSGSWNLFQSLFRSKLDTLDQVKDLHPSAQKNAAFKSVFTSFENLSQDKPLIQGYENNDWFNTRGLVLNNKALFYDAGASWMYSHWSGIDKTKVKKMYPVEMPVYKEVPFYMGGYNPMFAVMKNSPHADVATKVLMAFSTPTSAERWVRDAKVPSGVKGNVSQTGQGADQFSQFNSYIGNKYGGNIYDSKTVDYVLGQQYTGLTSMFITTLTDIMAGKITADAGYAKVMQAEATIGQ